MYILTTARVAIIQVLNAYNSSFVCHISIIFDILKAHKKTL